MSERIDQVTNYIQENCLWQFFSRSWDREANINGILKYTGDFLVGNPEVPESLEEKAYYADAKVSVVDLKKEFPWLTELSNDEVRALLKGVADKLIDITITKSLNGELNVPLY